MYFYPFLCFTENQNMPFKFEFSSNLSVKKSLHKFTIFLSQGGRIS